MKENKRPNHLIHEKSPYLLAHAYNEVDWYPWGEEAFTKAKIENKPIFLSIGYSTCHWCHVMEAESFLDEEIGSYLNEHYISIKVDKEERPDVDLVYMKVCQSLTGSGGWPLTIVMTPDKLPFFAGTYFPKLRRNGLTGLMDVLYSIHQQWLSSSGSLQDVGNKIVQYIQQQESIEQDTGPLTKQILYEAYTELEASYDEQYGGFSRAPKFPSPHQLLYLLRYGVDHKQSNALEMVEKTLLSMYQGGIFDHVGYGFSRYSVDERWEIPHFEKMLYDNALLLMAYLEAYEATKKPIYQEISEKVITFLLREMRSPEGAFYTALDADFEQEEGKYYSFSLSDLQENLSEEEFTYLKSYYQLPSNGNFEGNYVFNLLHVNEPTLDTPKMKDIREKLLQVRFQRGILHKDDKILTSWNGLILGTFALAGRYLKNDSYLLIAEQCVSFIKQYLLYNENKLYARYRDQEAKFPGYLDDYAYVSWGLVELFLATSKEEYLTLAITLTKSMIDQFYDHEQGGFFFSSKEGEEMLFHSKEYFDGAMPSGNSIACLTLIRLSEITDDICFEKVALQTFRSATSVIVESPRSYTAMLIAYMMHYQPMTKIVLLSSRKDQDYEEVKNVLDSMHLPFAVILKLCSKELENSLYFKHFLEEDQPLILYVCQDYECDPPLYEKEDILTRLKEINQ